MMLLKIKNSLLDTHIIKSKKNKLILFSNETNHQPINSTITDFYNWFDVSHTGNCYYGNRNGMRTNLHRTKMQRP